MKYLIGSTLYFLLFTSCQQDSRKEIIDIFQPSYHLKKVSTKVYNGLAFSDLNPSLLFLNSDTTFTLNNDGNTSLTGKWRFIKDSVEITPMSESNIVAFNVTLSKSSESKTITFIVDDKTGQPIKNFVVQPFNNKPLYIYGSSGLDVDSANHPHEIHFPSEYCTDNSGKIRLIKNNSDSLDFTKLYPLVRRHFRIGTHNLPDTVKLVINVNAITLSNEVIHPILGLLPPPGKFLIRGDRFIVPLD